jgi:hypothetical protein
MTNFVACGSAAKREREWMLLVMVREMKERRWWFWMA